MTFHFHHHITFGFAGKRSHNDLEDSRQPLEALFKALDWQLGEVDIRLYSGLADGADQIAAQTFVDLFAGKSKGVKRTLGALLPFSENIYLQTIINKTIFTQLYHDFSDQRLELDGVYIAGKSTGAVHSRNKAYQQQGSVLAKICDVLIAIAPYQYREGISSITCSNSCLYALHYQTIWVCLEKYVSIAVSRSF